jgi:uncharacterized protein YhfF
VREDEVGDEVPPLVGVRGAAVDSVSEPVFVIETTAVEVVRLSEVLPGRALSEGEGYLSVAEWRVGHWRFWPSDAEYRF